MSDLDRFDEQFNAFRGRKMDLKDIPDGEYVFKVTLGEVTATPKTRETVCKLHLEAESGPAKGVSVERLYFFSSQDKVDALGNDLLRLGFPSDTWTARHGKKFSVELPAALARMAGLRFKALKKNSEKDNKGKIYGNMTIIERVGDIPAAPAPGEAGPPAKPTADVPF